MHCMNQDDPEMGRVGDHPFLGALRNRTLQIFNRSVKYAYHNSKGFVIKDSKRLIGSRVIIDMHIG
jgi:hypothetical protein